MYDGVPSIRLEGDQERALALIPEAKALLYQVQEVIKKAGVDTFSMSKNVEDGYIYALCAHGQNILSISVAPEAVDEPIEEEEPEHPVAEFPEFYSGTVQGVPLPERTGTRPDGTTYTYRVALGFTPTPDCIDSHPDDNLVPAVRQETKRLAVEPEDPWMSELKNQTSSSQVYGQYGFLRASMYSGAMQKVVQLVMGLGRIKKTKLRDPENLTKPDSQYIKDVDQKGVQVRFDYKFHRTHGITVADDGRLWVVEISMSRGVLAMPLQYFPRSQTQTFRELAQDRKDDAMVRAVDDLLGLPTGESLPSTQRDLDAAIKAGTVLRLATPEAIAPFYNDWMAYSSACGWAFSPDGREAHNTGWQINEGDHIQSGAWYQINIHIGPTKEDPQPDEPIAVGSASLRKIKEGRIYCSPAGVPGTPSQYVPIKFYEPLLEGLVSHHGVPSAPTSGKLPISDTPMFVCFVDGALKVASYYHNPERLQRPPYKTLEQEYGPCLLAGSWELVQGEAVSLPRMMYTNEYDYRREVQTNYERLTHNSIDLGYEPAFAWPFLDTDHWATGVRYRAYANSSTVTRDINEQVTGVVIIPRFSREAFYFATADWEGKFVSDDPEAPPGPTPIQTQHRDWLVKLRDPHVYSMFRCGTYGETSFFDITWYIQESVPNRLRCRDGMTCPFVSNTQTILEPAYRAIDHYYIPSSECSLYADEGPWLGACEPLLSDATRQAPGYDNRYNTTYPFKQSAEAYLVTSGNNGAIQLTTTVERVNGYWSAISPDRFGNYQQITSTHSALGDDCVIYDTAPHDDPTRIQKVTGYTPGVIPPVAYPTFVGVNIP